MLGRIAKMLEGFLTSPELLLVTENNLAAQIDALEVGEHDNASGYKPTFKVTEMNQEQLSIEVQNSLNGKPECHHRRTVSESDIEVIHEKEVPKLHGILKQRSRTLSESSDEALNSSYGRQNSTLSGYNGGSESPISESEETSDGRRKSVSFSEQVQSTSYKTNASVTTLHIALKNRRKKAKKRDVKKQERENKKGRRRTNSGSSELSSSEELSSQTDDAEQDAEAEEQQEEDATVAPEQVLCQIAETGASKVAKKQKNKGKNKKGGRGQMEEKTSLDESTSTVVSNEDSQNPADDEGSPTESASVDESMDGGVNEKGISGNQGGEAQEHSESKTKPVDVIDIAGDHDYGTKNNDEQATENPQSVLSVISGENPGENTVMSENVDESKPACKGTSNVVDGINGTDAQSDGNAFKPETMLSWDDKPSIGGPESDGDKPSSGLGLSNSLMFELDDD